MWSAVVALALAASPDAPSPGATAALDRRRAEIAREILRMGGALRREIVLGDVHALVARVPPEGLRCAGRVVPRARVEHDLSTPGAWLHDTIFGGRGADGGASPSLAKLLRTAPELALAVSFVRDPRAGDVGRPCLEFREKDVPTPSAPFCFEQRGGRWWLVESLYPCG